METNKLLEGRDEKTIESVNKILKRSLKRQKIGENNEFERSFDQNFSQSM